MEELLLGLFKFGAPIIAFIYLIRQGLRFIYENELLDKSLFKFLFFFLVSFILLLLTFPLLVFFDLGRSESIIISIFLVAIIICMLIAVIVTIIVLITMLIGFLDFLGMKIFSSIPDSTILKFRIISFSDDSEESFIDYAAIIFRVFFINITLFLGAWLVNPLILGKVVANGLISLPQTQDTNWLEFLIVILLFLTSRLFVLILVYPVLRFFSRVLGI